MEANATINLEKQKKQKKKISPIRKQPFSLITNNIPITTIDNPSDSSLQVAFEVKSAILITGFCCFIYLLYWFKVVLVPFFLAIFLMYLVDPIVELIDVNPKFFFCIFTSRSRQLRKKSKGCSRAFASLCATCFVVFFFTLIGYIIVLSVNVLDVKAYQDQYAILITSIEGFLNKIGIVISINTTLKENVDKLAKLILTDLLDLFSNMLVTLIYLTYFLCTRVRLSDAANPLWSKIDSDIQHFVTIKAYLSLIVAILVTIDRMCIKFKKMGPFYLIIRVIFLVLKFYVCLNVGLAIVWGVLTFFLNWIPNIGALIASFLPVLIIVITPNIIMSNLEKFLAIIIPMSFHFFIGNFIEPKIFGKKLEINPVVVILALSAWGLLWGPVGMMLSIPLTGAFKIMLSELNLWPSLVALMEGTYFDNNKRMNQLNNNIHYSTSSVHSPSDDEGLVMNDKEYSMLSTNDETINKASDIEMSNIVANNNRNNIDMEYGDNKIGIVL